MQIKVFVFINPHADSYEINVKIYNRVDLEYLEYASCLPARAAHTTAAHTHTNKLRCMLTRYCVGLTAGHYSSICNFQM